MSVALDSTGEGVGVTLSIDMVWDLYLVCNASDKPAGCCLMGGETPAAWFVTSLKGWRCEA